MHLGCTSSVFSGIVRSILVVEMAIVASGCGENETTTNGRQLAWTQPASSAEEVRALAFRLYLDGTLSTISAVECPTRAAAGFECSGTLPGGLNGTHTLELSAVMGAIEGPRSAPLTVTLGMGLAVRSGISATEAPTPLRADTIEACASGAMRDCYELHRVGSALNRVTTLAASPDGSTVFVADSDVVQTISADGRETLFALNARPQHSVSITGIAVDPGFARTRSVFISWLEMSSTGESSLNVTRYRELAGTLGESATILSGVRVPADSSAPLAVDSEGSVYVGVPAARMATSRRASIEESGVVLRLNRDGLIPGTSPVASPILAIGFEAPSGLSVDEEDRLWLTGSRSGWASSIARLTDSAGRTWPTLPDLVTLRSAVASRDDLKIAFTRSSSSSTRDAFVVTGGRLFKAIRSQDGRSIDLRELTLDPRVSVLNVAAGRGSMYVVAEADGSTSVFQVDPQRETSRDLQRAEP